MSADRFGDAVRVRFWSKVALPTGPGDACWEWRAGHTPRGYGVFCTKGWGPPYGRQTYAHRISWLMAFGPIPDGMGVLHRCDNPCCVNPSHLFLGTQGDNMADAKTKGRIVSRTRLSDETVAAIRHRHAEGGVTFFRLAEEFGIAFQHAHAIVRGHRRSR